MARVDFAACQGSLGLWAFHLPTGFAKANPAGSQPPNMALYQHFFERTTGFEPRDPHLGKVTLRLRAVWSNAVTRGFVVRPVTSLSPCRRPVYLEIDDEFGRPSSHALVLAVNARRLLSRLGNSGAARCPVAEVQ